MGLRTSTNSSNGDLPTRSASSRQARSEAAFAELRFRRNVEWLHSLGARPLYELLAQLGRDHGIVPEITAKPVDMPLFTPEMLRVSGGDRFPPVVRVIGWSARQ
jgi:hypothetical protein